MTLDEAILSRCDAATLAALAAAPGVAPPAAGPVDPAALLAALVTQGRAAELIARLAALDPATPWAALPWPPAALAALHDALDHRLDLDGLRDLCLRLGVDYDSLPGEGKRARARELVLAMARQGRTGELLEDTGYEIRNTSSEALLPTRIPYLVPRIWLVVFLAFLAALYFWHQSRLWPEGPPLPEGVVGVAVAEFAETADCRRGARGREAAALVYESLARELAAGPGRRVALTRVGRVCDESEAAAAGARAGADVVVWGWRPASAGGLVAALTLIDPPAPVSADLAGSFEALIAGPGEPTFALTDRAAALARFLLGLAHAQAGEHAAAEAHYSAAAAALAGEPDGAAGRALAVVLTERAKARAALGLAEAARADFDAAEAHNPAYVRLLAARAADHYLRREWDAAEAYLDRAAAQGELLPAVAYGYGLLDFYRGRYAEAVVWFDRAIDRSAATGADAAVYYLARGYSFVELGACEAAAGDFRAAAGTDASAIGAAAEAAAAGCGAPSVAGAVDGADAVVPNATPSPTRLSPEEMAAGALPPAALSPTPTATPSSPPLLEIGTRGANVRRGPGAGYEVMATRRSGARLVVLGVSPGGEWYQVRVPGQGRGWVAAAYAALLGSDELRVTSDEWAGGGETRDEGRPPTADGGQPTRASSASPPSLPPSPPPTVAAWPPTPTAPAPPEGPRPTRTPAAPAPTLLPQPTVRW